MSEFYKLRNKARHYEWGSPVDIPRLLGMAADGTPWAELWIGSHSGSPSTAILDSGEKALGDLIASDPRRFLGEETARLYGALPFLLKLLSAEKPLSIQAHPNLAQAREGFERENRAGVPVDSPERNYKDPNHKPEIIAALTSFTGLCGFRDLDEIRALLAVFLETAPPVLREGFAPLTNGLSNTDPAAALRDFLAGLFGLSKAVREALTEYILSTCERSSELELMQDLARLYPGDPAVIAPLYLNVFRLEPGEAVFLEAGILHAYIHGFGVELMANSDNVLRGGLTPKYVDVPELMKILEFKPYKPRLITPNASCFSYPTPCEEFSLTRICSGVGASVGPRVAGTWSPHEGPALCSVTEGELIVANSDRETVVKQGESLFIPPIKNGESPLSLKGKFTMFVASCGLQAMNNEQLAMRNEQ
ncbi:MAG: mannose-6-phosphate isomerase, class I [Treponema sp.]|jgi:mannose-6-phosphate isomerase|nr:mannose-6-phosphate isomerase, class I [Treponema sp.]